MALTPVDKTKITKYLKEHAFGNICYLGLCDAIGKRDKVSDLEFLQYFTQCVANEFRKDIKISIKHVSKLISIVECFLEWMNKEGKEIDEVTLDTIRSFKGLYDSYLNRTGYDIDLDFTDNIIGSVLKTVNELYPCEEKDSESVAKYINQIAEMEDELKTLRRDLDEANRLYGLLQETNSELEGKNTSLEEELSSVRNVSKDRKKENKGLLSTIEGLNGKISELEGLLASARDEVNFYKPFKEQFEKLSTEVESLRRIIEDGLKEKRDADAKSVRDSKMESYIYQQLLIDGASINGLISGLRSKGFVTAKDEVYELLRKVKSKINIETNSFSLIPNYRIVSPRVDEDGRFQISVPIDCKHYDVMLVGDFHIKDLDNKILKGFDMLNDYCSKNGINLILNIGDFYHGTTGLPIDYGNAVSNYRIVEKSISMIPHAPGIYHAVLGGNHEKNMTKYGFDPIAMLTDAREDFINLGYTHSTIALNGFCNPIGCFDIYHPDSFNFPVDFKGEELDLYKVRNYLKNIYRKQRRSREDSYIDVFGHMHTSQFNYSDGYCFIPSYFEGGSKRGACHLRIYFDEDTGIKYMVFMPLTITDKLVRNTEIIYEKRLIK